MTFEYKVVPAPTRGRKARGVKTPADRFARALEDAINDLAAEGWEYLRTDTLPAEERQGLTGRTTVYQNMLVFRRARDGAADARPVPAGTRAEPRIEPEAPRRGTAPADTPAADTPAATPAEAPKGDTIDRMIADELAAARAPRLPSAGAAQRDPGSPAQGPAAKIPGLGGAGRGVAAE